MSLWERRNTQDIINRYIHSNSEIVKAQIISESWLKKVVNILKQSDQIDYQLKIRYISKMLSILALEIWYRLFISRSMTERQKL
jgi:asparagine synthase (glutamine-hydrolysing)